MLAPDTTTAAEFLNSVFCACDDDLTFDVDGETLRGGDSSFLEAHAGKLRVSPITDEGSCFVFGVQHDSCIEDWESQCQLKPTAALWRKDDAASDLSVGTSIFVWAFDAPQHDSDELAALVEGLGMEDANEHLPVPGTDNWQLAHHNGPTHTLAKMVDVYVNGNYPKNDPTDPGEPTDPDGGEPTEGPEGEAEVASGASGFRTYAAGEKYHDAVCVTEYNEADYSKEVVVSIGANRQSKNWNPVTLPVGSVLKTFCIHEVGKKDGKSIVLGDMVPGARLKTATKALYFGGLDIDNGTPTATVIAAMKRLGCVGVVCSTHSSGKTNTEIKKDAVVKHAGDGEITDELMREFLLTVKQWDRSIVDTVKYVGTDHTEKGIVCQITHAPMPKHRVIIPFAEQFIIENEGKTHAEAMKRWAKVLEALANLLGVPFDKSCTDPSRLFYLPRHAKGKPFSISLFGGPYFDWRTFQLEDPMEKLNAALNKGKSKSVTPKGRDLGRWSIKRAHGFQIKDVIDAYAPDKIRHNTGHGYETECPFDEDHHNAGAQEDRACLVVNAGEGPSEFFTISCRHESCRDKTMLDMLGKMIADGWFPEEVIHEEQFNAILEEDEKPEAGRKVEAVEGEEPVRAALNGLTAESSKSEVENIIRLIVENDLPEGSTEIALNVIVETTGGTKSLFKRRALDAMLRDARKAKNTEGTPLGGSSEKLSQRISKSLGRPFQFPPKHLGKFSLCEDDQKHVWLCRENDGGSQVRLCAPFALSGGVVYADREQHRAHRIEMLSPEEKWIKLDINSGKLATPTLVLEELMDKGFAMTEQGRQFVPQYLSESRPRGLTVYHRAGFRDGCFVCPTGEVLLTDRHVELADDVRLKCASKAGNPESWKSATEALFNVPEAWRFQVGVLMGVAGTMSNLVGDDSLMYELAGGSSRGKSTAQELAAASWADPGVNAGGLFCAANGTQNSQETLLEVSSGTLRALDEIGKLDASAQSDLAFMNQAGSGKHRMNRLGGAQKTRTWGGLALIVSSETTFAQRLRAAGIAQLGGLSVRVFPIVFDETAALSKEEYALTKVVKANFGWFGPAFVQALVDQGYVRDPQCLRDEIDELISTLPGTSGEKDSFRKRAARPLGYLWKAGLIAAEAGLLPADYDFEAQAMRLWEDARGSDIGPTDASERAVETLIDSIIARKGREIVGFDEREERGVREALGYFDATVKVADASDSKPTKSVYVLRSGKLSELSGGTVPDRALRRKLDDLGYLVRPPAGNNLTWDYFPGLGKAQYVVLYADKIDADPKVAEVGERQAEPEKDCGEDAA